VKSGRLTLSVNFTLKSTQLTQTHAKVREVRFKNGGCKIGS
jgi:hypothetical protein